MRREVIGWRGETKLVTDDSNFADERFEETRPFKPPVPEELRIERDGDDRIFNQRCQLMKLTLSRFEEVLRVRVGYFARMRAIVEFLRHIRAPGDAVILQAGEAWRLVTRMREGVAGRKIEADVAVKVAIRRIARITTLRAPDFAARNRITRKRGWSSRR